ncbi:MAG: nucleotide exchange factor GrpE [Cytophagales bacterium]|jgi:molecular chaperone GrpE|nr:nucleotide exchange factor GrpE [Cytophagales bacterium]|tara:strand:+ start:304 stop:783 length:480 start_codon:yes stop_codon:yes gene_type:complete
MNKKKTNKSTQPKKTKKGKNLTSELQETKDKYLRLYSEFENYRRRTSKEKIEMIHSANKDLLKDILPVIDDYERAVKANKENEIEGFSLIFQKLKTTLEKYNVKKMEIKKGDDFDSELHEAITSSPSDKKLKGKIIDIIEDGYHVGDSILRFAKVVTGS